MKEKGQIKIYQPNGELYPNIIRDEIIDAINHSITYKEWAKYLNSISDKFYLINYLNDALIRSGISEVGYLKFYGLKYVVLFDDLQHLLDEYVLIYHNDEDTEITAINVTADSKEAMLRDIMRALTPVSGW